MSQIPGYLTVAEAAREIGVSHAQTTRYIKAGILDHKTVGSQYLVPTAAAENFQRPARGNPNFTKKTQKKRRK